MSVSVLAENKNTPRKTQKNNQKNIKYQNVNYRGPSFNI